MAGNGETNIEQFTTRELAYLEYVGNQQALGSTELTLGALGTELSGIKAEIASAEEARRGANNAFRLALANTSEAIASDETLDPLERYIWSATFAWASKEKSVNGSTDLVAFATGFQERVKAIEDRLSEETPFIAVDWQADNTVYAGSLLGDKLVIDEDGVKTPELKDGVTAWIGWGHSGEWTYFNPEALDDGLTLFHTDLMQGEDPLSYSPGNGLDMLGGWDEQPGFAREQKVFVGLDEITGFLNNTERALNARYHGLIAAGFAGVDIAKLEQELPKDLVERRDGVAVNIAEVIAGNILSDAINASTDDALRKSAVKHATKHIELPQPSHLKLYTESIGIHSDKLVELVTTELEVLSEEDFLLSMVIPKVLPTDQVAGKVAKVLSETTEELAA